MLFRMVTLARDLHFKSGLADAAAWVIRCRAHHDSREMTITPCSRLLQESQASNLTKYFWER